VTTIYVLNTPVLKMKSLDLLKHEMLLGLKDCLKSNASSPKSERDFQKSSFSHRNTEKSDYTVEVPGNSVAIPPQNSARFWKLSLPTTCHASEKDDVLCSE
jgi:hypothetical protein